MKNTIYLTKMWRKNTSSHANCQYIVQNTVSGNFKSSLDSTEGGGIPAAGEWWQWSGSLTRMTTLKPFFSFCSPFVHIYTFLILPLCSHHREVLSHMSLIHVLLEQEYVFLVWIRTTWACDIGGEADTDGLAQSGEEMALEGAVSSNQPPYG